MFFEPDTVVVAARGLSIPGTVLMIGKKKGSVYLIAELTEHESGAS